MLKLSLRKKNALNLFSQSTQISDRYVIIFIPLIFSIKKILGHFLQDKMQKYTEGLFSWKPIQKSQF